MSNAASIRFGPSAMDALKAKVAQTPQPAASVATPQRIPLTLIDEDPDQPRKHFDDAALRTLADSIALPDTGLLQPITVRPVAGGRYVVCYGARRLRAVRLLGWPDIPALVRDDKAGIAGQVIENRQRQDNTDSELAAAIATLTDQGRSNADIATILALSDPQSLKHYRALANVREIPDLARWIDRTDVRALYELHNAWHRDDGALRPAIGEGLAEADELTVTSARRIVNAAQAGVIEAHAAEARAAEPQPEPAEVEAGTPSTHAADTPAPEPDPAPTRPARAERTRSAAAASPAALPEEERERRARAWLDSPQRPRPPLNV